MTVPARPKQEDGKICVQKIAPNVLIARVNLAANGAKKDILFRSDAHHDSALCDRRLETKHLDQAVERDAWILDTGDVFDAMGGPDDRRNRNAELRDPHLRKPYFDSIVEEAAKDYKPYADRWLMLGRGNHETSVEDRYGTDLIARLAHDLNVHTGEYAGWIGFRCDLGGNRSNTVWLYYHHGPSTGGINKGINSVARMSSYLADANIVCSGHSHDQWIASHPVAKISKFGKEYLSNQLHVRAPGYKEEWLGSAGRFHIKTAKPPKPTGAIWLTLYADSSDKASSLVKYEAAMAL